MNRWNYYYDDVKAPELYRQMHGPLMARALGLGRMQDVANFQLPDDRVCVFFYAPMPDSFLIQHDELGQQSGQVLYVIDVLRPESESND